MRPTDPPTLVLGLGNPLLGDDGAGWRVVEAVQRAAPAARAEFDWHAGGGLALMERLIGYDRAVIVDALQTGRGPVGHVRCCPLEELPAPACGHLASAHETSLRTALEVGQRLGARLPRQIVVVGIEARPSLEFSEQLSPAVARAVPKAARRVCRLLEEDLP
jgi:hydrogenase maturation protease